MKKIVFAFAIMILTLCSFFLLQKNEHIPQLSIGSEEDPNAREEYEFMVIRDPVRNEIPKDIHRMEFQLLRRLPSRESYALAKGNAVEALQWTERGPFNIGGRSRTFAADVEHPGVLIAGCVDGGIWKSTDDGASWKLKLTPQQTHSTSCIAQDTRPGKRHLWYVGTGEFRGSTTNDTRWGSFYNGDGIYKSTDDGETWDILPSTMSGTPNLMDAFDFIWTVATNPANLSHDEVYAATWRGIYRSTNGGATWNVAMLSDSGIVNTSTVTTDVAITLNGVIYAHTRENGLLKIWRSTDGITWTSIAPNTFPTTSGRVVFATAPSDTNVLYIFVQGPNNTPATAGHQLWKYTFNNAGSTWENRSANLPTDLSTQAGYDQTLHVKPDNADFLILGGTDLYRSTDGFKTSLNFQTIGGYPYYPDGQHHPDMQGGMFKPTNPNIYYSSNDGGVQRADDITMNGMMKWTWLNNGYNVTQLYSVSISPDSGDHTVIAGAQDNGSLATDSLGMSSWRLIYGGDGTVLELPPVADDRMYTQYQSGPMQRQTRSGQKFSSLNPNGAIRQLFVNPIILDPNNSKIMYYGAGSTISPTFYSGIWRNNNVPNGTATIGWTPITASDVGTPSGSTRAVSAIGVSKLNNPNVVYIGTTDGIVKRIDNAESATPTGTLITPPGLNGGNAQGGFVRCIAVDKTNSNRALLAFGNYNIKSLWLTSDGGSTWSDVEGNLSGPSGPSIRWATLVYVGNQLNVFIGTSIGLLMTSKLQGDSTVWVQAAANEIGNVLISYMDYRESDRTLVVGTFGRGVFSTQIPNTPLSVTTTSKVPQQFVLEQNFPNPFNPVTTIRYSLPSSATVKLTIVDVQGKIIATLVNEEQSAGWKEVVWKGSAFSSGIYFYKLQAGNYVGVKKLMLLK